MYRGSRSRRQGRSRAGQMGVELRGAAVIGLVGSATAASYDPQTGNGAATRVDAANQSFVQITGLGAVLYRVSLRNSGANGINVRNGNQGASIALALLTGESSAVYIAAPVGGVITITSGSGVVSFTNLSIRAA